MKWNGKIRKCSLVFFLCQVFMSEEVRFLLLGRYFSTNYIYMCVRARKGMCTHWRKDKSSVWRSRKRTPNEIVTFILLFRSCSFIQILCNIITNIRIWSYEFNLSPVHQFSLSSSAIWSGLYFISHWWKGQWKISFSRI